MKKTPVLIAFIILHSIICRGQKRDLFLGGSINIPLGDFATSHWLGINAELFSIKYQCDSAKQKTVSFTYKAGVSYYFAGQRQKVSGFSYDHPSYYFAYGLAGVLLRPYKRLNVAVAAGPAISRYKGISRFNIAGEIEGNYFIHCNLSVGPSLFMIKETGANALWALELKLNFRL